MRSRLQRLSEVDLPIKRISALDWQAIMQARYYRLRQDSVTQPVHLREDSPPYGTGETQ